MSGALGTTEKVVLLLGSGYIAATKLRPAQWLKARNIVWVSVIEFTTSPLCASVSSAVPRNPESMYLQGLLHRVNKLFYIMFTIVSGV